jgi:hypothetical protein
MVLDRRNKVTRKDEINNVINSLDTSEIKGNSTKVSVKAELDDTGKDFTEKGTDFSSDRPIKANSENPKYFDSRFSKDLTAQQRKLVKRID